MWWMHDAGTGWWIFGAVWMTLFWAAIIAVVIWGVAKISRRDETWDDPLEIARRRYARGEIDREQFERLQHDLR